MSKKRGRHGKRSSPRRDPGNFRGSAGGKAPAPPPGRKPKKSRASGNSGVHPMRELEAVLSYGPQFVPHFGAWTDSRIEQVRAFRRWVYVAIDTIATEFVKKRPNVSRLVVGKKGSDPSPRDLAVQHALRHKALLPLQAHEFLEPVAYNHPLRRLLDDPNEPDFSWTLWYQTVMYLLLTGNAYWWVPPLGPRLRVPAAAWVLPSHWVHPYRGSGKVIESYELRPVEGNYYRQVLPAEEVVHFQRPNPISKIDGFSPLTAIAQWVDVSEQIDRSRWHAYDQGIFPTVAVQFDGSINDPDEPMLRRIEAKIISRSQGPNRSGKPLFLPPGVKVSPISLKPNEMVFGETSLETARNILIAYGIPPRVVGLPDPASSGTADDHVRFCSRALNPLAEFLGQCLTEKLCPRYPQGSKGGSSSPGPLRTWWEAFTPDDPAHLEQTIKTDLLAGAISPNEVRLLRGREPWPYDWADRPIIPVNMAPGTLPGGGTHLGPSYQPEDVAGPGSQPALNPDDSKALSDIPIHRFLTNGSSNGHAH